VRPHASPHYLNKYEDVRWKNDDNNEEDQHVVRTSERETSTSVPSAKASKSSDKTSKPSARPAIPGIDSSTKTILYFNSYFDMKDFAFGFGRKPFVDNKCPVDNCYATNNK